ncbi:hypothetical protein HaLaN_31811, partial [Haematococcus lacustris]
GARGAHSSSSQLRGACRSDRAGHGRTAHPRLHQPRCECGEGCQDWPLPGIRHGRQRVPGHLPGAA